MYNDDGLVRETGSATATRLMTLEQQLVGEYGTASVRTCSPKLPSSPMHSVPPSRILRSQWVTRR